jgi:hypothetical protein
MRQTSVRQAASTSDLEQMRERRLRRSTAPLFPHARNSTLERRQLCPADSGAILLSKGFADTNSLSTATQPENRAESSVPSAEPSDADTLLDAVYIRVEQVAASQPLRCLHIS